MIAFARRALRELASRREGTVVLTLPAALADIPTSVTAGASGLTLWDDAASDRDGRAWSFVGWGEAARIDANGPRRIDRTLDAARSLFASIVEVRHTEAEVAPSPRLFGGIAFHDDPSQAEPWRGFAGASFALPRFVYGRSGTSAFLRAAFRHDEIRDPEAAVAEIERALASLTERASTKTGTNTPATRPGMKP